MGHDDMWAFKAVVLGYQKPLDVVLHGIRVGRSWLYSYILT